jgi:hypothetical protein
MTDKQKLRPCSECGGPASKERVYDTNCINPRCSLYDINFENAMWNAFCPNPWIDASKDQPDTDRDVLIKFRVGKSKKVFKIVGYFTNICNWYVMDEFCVGCKMEEVYPEVEDMRWMKIPK